MALTSTPHRRREPGRSLGIPTIPDGRFDGGTPDASAVDAELLTRSTPRGLGGRPGALASRRLTPARPLLVPTQPPSGGSTSAQPWAPSSGRPTPRGWGSTGQGSCILHEPTTHVEYPHPFSSSTQPSCSRRPELVVPTQDSVSRMTCLDPRMHGAD